MTHRVFRSVAQICKKKNNKTRKHGGNRERKEEGSEATRTTKPIEFPKFYIFYMLHTKCLHEFPGTGGRRAESKHLNIESDWSHLPFGNTTPPEKEMKKLHGSIWIPRKVVIDRKIKEEKKAPLEFKVATLLKPAVSWES